MDIAAGASDDPAADRTPDLVGATVGGPHDMSSNAEPTEDPTDAPAPPEALTSPEEAPIQDAGAEAGHAEAGGAGYEPPLSAFRVRLPDAWAPPPASASAREAPAEETPPTPAEEGEPPQVRSETFVSETPPIPTPAPPETSNPLPGHRRGGAHRRRARWMGVELAVALVAAALLAGTVVAARATARLPLASIHSTVPTTRVVPGSSPALPWPNGAQSAVAIPSLGVVASSGQEVPQPIASLTKLMTADVVLSDHPLSATQDGPTVTITAADVETYREDNDSDQANVQVAEGEVLTERQLLEGMLVHSANNFADLLAVWDAGSIDAFVQKMNATANSLGMKQTTYSDASGISTSTVSTAMDQLKLATTVARNAVFDAIVDQTSVTLPVAGVVASYTPLLGYSGVVGLKSGFTSAAGGCDVLAMVQEVHGVRLEIISVVLGNQSGDDLIGQAGLEALSIARQALAGVRVVNVATPGERVATASLSGHTAAVVARGGASILVWPGQHLIETLRIDRPPPAGAPAGWRVGAITAHVGNERRAVPVSTASVVPTPSFFQRVF